MNAELSIREVDEVHQPVSYFALTVLAGFSFLPVFEIGPIRPNIKAWFQVSRATLSYSPVTRPWDS